MGLSGAPQRYVVIDDTIVPESGARRQVLDIIRQNGTAAHPPVIQLRFSVQQIRLVTNLRIFGVEGMPGMTVKLTPRAPQPGLYSIPREVHGRRIVSRHLNGKIGIPVIRAHSAAGGWLVEDFIDGRRAVREDLARFVVRHAETVYLSTARLRRVKRNPARARIVMALEKSLNRLFPPIDEQALWAECVGHNDLHLDNLLCSSDGKMWLLDWEHCGVVPLARDLGAIFCQMPTLRPALLGLLALADPNGQALDPPHQLALGASLALQRLAEQRRRDIRVLVAERGLSEREAEREIDGTMEKARQSIARLAA